jgi:hypothetical protein
MEALIVIFMNRRCIGCRISKEYKRQRPDEPEALATGFAGLFRRLPVRLVAENVRIESMSTASVIPTEIEQERARQAAELEADSGADWAREYRPGSFGCHELLDRTALLADMVEQQIQTHPACVANAEWFLLAEQASAALRELYQQIGAEHLGADESSAEVP